MTEEALRERVRARKGKSRGKPPWLPPTLKDFAHGVRVAAFDQSINNTGVVCLTVTSGGIRIEERWVTRPDVDPDLRSMDATLQRSVSMDHKLGEDIDSLLEEGPMVIVVERTPLEGWRTESSLLASHVIHRHADRTGTPLRVVANNHAKAVMLAPNRRADKIMTKDITERHNLGGRWNEHTRDALMVGLTFLYDLKREQDQQ